MTITLGLLISLLTVAPCDCYDVKFLDDTKLFEAQHFSAFYDITTYVERCKSLVKHLLKTYPPHVIEKTTT